MPRLRSAVRAMGARSYAPAHDLPDAYCASDADPGAWFADPDSETSRVLYAISVCGSCPLQRDCQKEAPRHEYGVWGGIVRKPARSWTPPDPVAFEALFFGGETANDLAFRYSVSAPTIRRYLSRSGIDDDARRTYAEREARVLSLWNEGRTQSDIAVLCGYEGGQRSVFQVLAKLKASGHKVRDSNGNRSTSILRERANARLISTGA